VALSWGSKHSENLRVGDVIKIKERVPADCVVLNSTCVEGDIYIKTDQLDGETDWKQKSAIHLLEKVYNESFNKNDAEFYKHFQHCTFIDSDEPNKNIYKFSGKVNIAKVGFNLFEGVSEDNCLWANTKVTTGSVQALVI